MTQAGSEVEVRKDLSITQGLTRKGWTPQSLDDLRQICVWIANSRLAPRGFDTPEKVFIGCQTAMEAGLPMLSGLRMLYVVHNVPSWLGKGALALIRSSGVCDCPPELRYEGEGSQRRAIWRFKRKDMPAPVEVDYTWEQAIKAGYDKKEGAWQSDPEGMLSWRAVSRLGDRYFSDILCGLDIYESVRDYPPEAFERAGTGELPAGEPPVSDPLMAGAGQAPAPTTPSAEEPEALVDKEQEEGEGVHMECPHCGAVDLYGPASDFACTACGADVREAPSENEPDKLRVTLPQLRKMLKRVGVAVAPKATSAWTEEQAIAAYNWAFDEQMVLDAAEAECAYDRQVPDRPAFLPEPTREAPASTSAPKPTAPATVPKAPVAVPVAEDPGEPSPYSTPEGDCINARQAGALRGMAQNRCTELGLKEADARLTFVMDALGCRSEQVTEDMYDAAKTCLKEHTPEF